MGNELFRKKSLDKISSPEDLHDYMRVTSPRLWMILTAIAVMLVGFIVYASTVTMENTKTIKVMVQNMEALNEETQEPENYTSVSAMLPLSQKDLVQPGMVIRIGQETGTVSWVASAVDEDVITVVFDMGKTSIPLPAGECDGELVIESTTPISFLWN